MVNALIKNKLLAGFLASISLNLLLATSTYYYMNKSSDLTAEMQVCTSFNQSLQDTIEKEKAACEVERNLVERLMLQSAEIDRTLLDSTSALMSIPNRTATRPTRSEVVENDEDSVDIDGALPPDLIRLLDHHYRLSN